MSRIAPSMISIADSDGAFARDGEAGHSMWTDPQREWTLLCLEEALDDESEIFG